MRTAIEVVREWHEALNQGDLDKLINLVHTDVVMEGPRGKVSGVTVLREWFGRANVKLHPLTYFEGNSIIVVEEEGEWIVQSSGESTERQRVATHFKVAGGLITHIARHDQLEVALSEAGLTTSDRV